MILVLLLFIPFALLLVMALCHAAKRGDRLQGKMFEEAVLVTDRRGEPEQIPIRHERVEFSEN